MDVSVIVLTYNQERTIKRTIESILSQETEFSFEIIIGDDGSTDDTRLICANYAQEYPDKIKLVPEHANFGVVKNYSVALNECTGRYIMECAGDDWWHNINKIQVQVTFMDSNFNCVFCHGGFIEFYPATRIQIEKKPMVCSKPFFESILRTNPVCAPTVCIRKSAMDQINFSSFVETGFMVEDYPSWLGLSLLGDICSLEEPLVTYTQQMGSVHNCKDYNKRLSYINNFRIMRQYFVAKTPYPEKYAKLIDNIFNLQKAEAAIKYGQRKDALKAFLAVKGKDSKTWVKILICNFSPLFNRFNAKYTRNYCL